MKSHITSKIEDWYAQDCSKDEGKRHVPVPAEVADRLRTEIAKFSSLPQSYLSADSPSIKILFPYAL